MRSYHQIPHQQPNKRYRKRSRQRGAAVFVVMMAILILTSVGVWAIHAAGMTSAASGYQRAAAQTLYTAELGIIVGTSYFSMPGYADANYRAAQSQLDNPAKTPDACASIQGRAFCKSLYMEDIDTTINTETNTFGDQYSVLDLASAEGSMGPRGSALSPEFALEGHFVLEMTDPRPVLVAGTDVKSNMYQKVTLTSYGTVRPFDANRCSQAANSAASQLAIRSHVIIGPVNQ